MGGTRAGLVFAALLACCHAKYEEEIGRFDFHKQVFGGMTAASFQATGRRVFLAGKGGVVGAVSAKSGSVQWRRIVSDQSSPIAHIKRSDTGVIAACANGHVNIFGDDGALLWETVVPGMTGAGNGDAETQKVVGISGESGEEWAAVVTATATHLQVHPIAAQSDTRINWVAAETVALPEAADPATLRVGNGVVFVQIAGSNAVAVLAQLAGGAKWTVVSLGLEGYRLYTAVGRDAALRNTRTGECVDITAEGAVGKPRDGGVVCIPGGSPLSTDIEGFPEARGFGGVVASWAAVDKSAAVERVVVKMASGATVLFVRKNDAWKVNWVRDDGLGDVTDVVSVGNPRHSDDEERSPTMVEQYVRLLQGQVEGVASLATRLPLMANNLAQTMAGNAPKATGLAEGGDQFGLQVHFVLNSANTLYCLSTADGEVKWQVFAGLMVPAAEGSAVTIQKVLLSSSDTYDVPHLYVWLRETTAAGKRFDYIAQLMIMKAGIVKDFRKLDGNVQKASVVTQLRYQDQAGHAYEAVVLVMESKKLVAHPPAAAAVLASSKFSYYMVNDDGSVAGYSGDQNTWRVQVTAAAGEEVIASSLETYQPKLFVTVDNLKVIGNTSTAATAKNEVVSKYVNPNAVLLVTAVPAGVVRDVRREAYLVFYLVDGVTGAILMSMVQPNAVGPVRVVPVEHMYVVHFFNTKRKRYQMSVLELFEDTDRVRGVYSDSVTSVKQVVTAFMGLAEPNTYSSFEVAPPRVVPTAFTFPLATRALGSTVSELGVGSKHLIAALSTDEIVTLDLNKHMEANAKMGVSIIAYRPTSTITTNMTVIGVDSIKTFASKLESTCLMVAVGNDVYFSRVTAGKPFDMLDEDFAYPVLVLTVLVISTLTFGVSRLAQANQLKAQWV